MDESQCEIVNEGIQREVVGKVEGGQNRIPEVKEEDFAFFVPITKILLVEFVMKETNC